MYKRNRTQGQPSFSMFLAFFPFPPLPTGRQNSDDISPRPENSPPVLCSEEDDCRGEFSSAIPGGK